MDKVYLIVKIVGDWYTAEELDTRVVYRSENTAEAIAKHLEKRTGGKFKVVTLEVE